MTYFSDFKVSCFAFWRFETYDSDEPLRTRVGKRVRVAATSTVNLNISAANLETFLESIVSWRRQEEIDQKSVKANEVILAL